MKTLYATDLDGTLLSTSKVLNPKTVEIVNRLIDDGVYISVITARVLFSIVDLLEPININVPIGIMNGAGIYDLKNKKFVHTYPIPQEQSREVVNACKAQGITPMVFVKKGNEGHVYYDMDIDPIVKRLFSEMDSIKEYYHRVENLDDIIDTCEILVIEGANEKEKIRTVYRKLRDEGNVNLVSYEDVYGSGYHHIEVFSGETNKGVAAKYVANYLGADRMVTFGDNYSDIDMFNVSDDSYAMENGLEETKSAADHVLGHCNDDVVAECIKALEDK